LRKRPARRRIVRKGMRKKRQGQRIGRVWQEEEKDAEVEKE
jgi:hypothetical protein